MLTYCAWYNCKFIFHFLFANWLVRVNTSLIGNIVVCSLYVLLWCLVYVKTNKSLFPTLEGKQKVGFVSADNLPHSGFEVSKSYPLLWCVNCRTFEKFCVWSNVAFPSFCVRDLCELSWKATKTEKHIPPRNYKKDTLSVLTGCYILRDFLRQDTALTDLDFGGSRIFSRGLDGKIKLLTPLALSFFT